MGTEGQRTVTLTARHHARATRTTRAVVIGLLPVLVLLGLIMPRTVSAAAEALMRLRSSGAAFSPFFEAGAPITPLPDGDEIGWLVQGALRDGQAVVGWSALTLCLLASTAWLGVRLRARQLSWLREGVTTGETTVTWNEAGVTVRASHVVDRFEWSAFSGVEEGDWAAVLRHRSGSVLLPKTETKAEAGAQEQWDDLLTLARRRIAASEAGEASAAPEAEAPDALRFVLTAFDLLLFQRHCARQGDPLTRLHAAFGAPQARFLLLGGSVVWLFLALTNGAPGAMPALIATIILGGAQLTGGRGPSGPIHAAGLDPAALYRWPTALQVTPGGLRVAGGGCVSFLTWAAVQRIERAPGAVYLYLAEGAAVIVPRHAFVHADAEAAWLARLEAAAAGGAGGGERPARATSGGPWRAAA